MNGLTIATYNIRHGRDVHLDFDILAESIKEVSPHVVGVQEIDMKTNRVHGMDTMEALQRATGMPYACFAPAIDFDGGQYGIGVLSVYPIRDIQVFPLESGADEQRVAWRGVIGTPWGDMTFVNTHLSLGGAEKRAPQFQALRELLPCDMAYALTGDFNTQDEHEFAGLRDVGAELVNSGDGLCMTFRTTPMAIDHILYPTKYMTLQAFGMVDNPHSDHNLLYARFQVNMGK